jgi:hypothetical protein
MNADMITSDIAALRSALASVRTQVKAQSSHKALLSPLVKQIAEHEKALDSAEQGAAAGLADRDRLQGEIAACDAERRSIVFARAELPHSSSFDPARVLELRDLAEVNAARMLWLRSAYDSATSRAEAAALAMVRSVRKWLMHLDGLHQRARGCFAFVLDPRGSSAPNVRAWAASACPVDRAAFVLALLQIEPSKLVSNGHGSLTKEWEAALESELLPLLAESKEAV